MEVLQHRRSGCCNQQLDMACHKAILVLRAGTALVPANQLQSWPDGLGAAKPSRPALQGYAQLHTLTIRPPSGTSPLSASHTEAAQQWWAGSYRVQLR